MRSTLDLSRSSSIDAVLAQLRQEPVNEFGLVFLVLSLLRLAEVRADAMGSELGSDPALFYRHRREVVRGALELATSRLPARFDATALEKVLIAGQEEELANRIDAGGIPVVRRAEDAESIKRARARCLCLRQSIVHAAGKRSPSHAAHGV